MANSWGGFTADNVFDSWDLNPLAQQVGGGADGVRDRLATERDAFLQPRMQQYRTSGVKAAEDDATLFNDDGFRSFVQSGQLPQNASPAQQWNAQPAPAATGPAQGAQGQSTLMNLLMQRAQQPTTVGRDDPNVRGQADAYRANIDRSTRNYLADVAEQQGPYGNINNETRLAQERAGQASGGFEAELMGRETDARRQEIQDALTQWGSLLSGDQRMALERELAMLSNSTQRASLAQQNNQFTTSQNNSMEQFWRELALREADQNNAWDFRWATA